MLLQIDKNLKTLAKIKASTLHAFGLDERTLQGLLFDNLEGLLPETEFVKIMQSKQGGEHPDILAIDSEGTLYIFELKIWESQSENLLQALRYGQLYGSYGYNDLNTLFQEHNRAKMTLREKFDIVFNADGSRFFPEDSLNKKQVFVIISNGVDNKTREGIRYWKSQGLDVRAWPYQVYPTPSNQDILLEMAPFTQDPDLGMPLESRFYIVNTNASNSMECHDNMLAHQKVAAYSDPWNKKIERLQEGDTVFLYQTGKGIVATGTVTGDLIKGASHSLTEEYSKKLSNFKLFKDNPLPASEIKALTNTNIQFRHTLFSLDEEAGLKLKQYVDTQAQYAKSSSLKE